MLRKREGAHRNVIVTVVTSDRGLCGAFNANILRTAVNALKELESRGVKAEVAVVGRKGRDFFRRRDWKVRREVVDIFDKLSFEHGMVMGEEFPAIVEYIEGRIDAVYIIYNEFKSAIQQRVVVEQLLPFDWIVEITGVKDLTKPPMSSPEAINMNRVRTNCSSTFCTVANTSRRTECCWNLRPPSRAPAWRPWTAPRATRVS